jgi:hypothetical protein
MGSTGAYHNGPFACAGVLFRAWPLSVARAAPQTDTGQVLRTEGFKRAAYFGGGRPALIEKTTPWPPVPPLRVVPDRMPLDPRIRSEG